MLFGLNWKAWAAIAGAVLALALAAFFLGRADGYGARDRLAVAEREAMIAQAVAKTKELQAEINRLGANLAEATHARERASRAAVAQGQEDIRNAVQTLDAQALYAAFALARERVYANAGLAPTPGADPGAGGIAPGLPDDGDPGGGLVAGLGAGIDASAPRAT